MRRYYAILFFILFFLFISPWFTYFLVTIPTPCGLGFITTENQDTWIGFFGAIIGGGATLIGVWWTIFQQKKDEYNNTNPMLLVTIETRKTTDSFTLIEKIENIGNCNAEMVDVRNLHLPNISKGYYDGSKLLPPKFSSFAYVAMRLSHPDRESIYFRSIVTWESKYKRTKYTATYDIQLDYDLKSTFKASVNLFDLQTEKLHWKCDRQIIEESDEQ